MSKGPDMCSFLDEVRITNGGRKVVTILDSGRIHHTDIVTAHATDLNITLVFLPPYSPQFNPIEIVWKTIKTRISGMFLLYRDHLVEAVRDALMAETTKSGYTEAWKRRFFNGPSL